MNACQECDSLNGKSSVQPPHSQLEFLTEFGAGTPGALVLMSRRYRCRSCGTHMLAHSENGDIPNLWEARPL